MVPRSLNTDGCEFGRMVKKDLNFLVKKIEDGFGNISVRLDKSDKNQVELFNHQSGRLPMWATILFTILGSIVTGLLVAAVKG